MHMLPAVKDVHEVGVTVILPCMHAHYPAKADHYLSHLIGHEGPGSLMSALKARGWATELVAGIEEDGYDCNSFAALFGVTMTLTEAGLAAGPGYGLAPVALLFQFINMMRAQGGWAGAALLRHWRWCGACGVTPALRCSLHGPAYGGARASSAGVPSGRDLLSSGPAAPCCNPCC
jgi:hypothetical protein